MNIPYDEMPEKIEELMIEVERLESKIKHLRELQKSMDKQYEELEQENRQLKEKLKLVESLTCFNMPNNTPMVCMFKADYERNKYEYETLDKYKSVLDEIREYIEKEASHYAYEDDWDFYLCEEQIEDLLQILDKVKE